MALTTDDRLLNEFLFYILNYIGLEQVADTTSIPQINNKHINPFIIPIPPKPEQKAIATALSDVDNLIASLEALIAKKEHIKTATMQQLLTGKKRLDGFSGEWVEKKLGEVAKIKKGELITESSSICGDIPVVAGGLQPTYFHNRSNRDKNTITISASGANAGFINFYECPIFASDCSTIEESDEYSVEFIFYLLKNRQNEVTNLQTGGAQPHVYPEQLKELNIVFPKDIKEQQAIAQILSDMDKEIEALKDKLKKTKAIKMGMMQELLTGKIRLKGETNGNI